MEGNEVPRLCPLEQAQCIGRGKMASTKAGFPPWSMTNREERYIQLPASVRYVLVNDAVRVLRERRITSEEDCMPFREEQIHVGS